jgi:hypothetical protein
MQCRFCKTLLRTRKSTHTLALHNYNPYYDQVANYDAAPHVNNPKHNNILLPVKSSR